MTESLSWLIINPTQLGSVVPYILQITGVLGTALKNDALEKENPF